MEEELIDFVKNNAFLYNKRCSHYKNKYLREKKFEELSSHLHVPAQKLKERWRTLKDKFYRELKKEQFLSTNGLTSHRKKWKWMEHFSFLRDVNTSNSSTFVNSPKKEIDDSCSFDPIYAETCSPTSTFPQGAFSSTSASAEAYLTDTSFTDSYSDTAQNVSMTVLDEKKHIFADILKDAKNDMTELLALAKETASKPQPAKKTSTQMFFEFMAKQTEEAGLSPRKFARLQMELLITFNKVAFDK